MPLLKVADVGCGDVGVAGKNVKKCHRDKFTIVRGTAGDPKLHGGQLDAISLQWVYHELTKYLEMLAQFKRALKPGGRLVMIDPLPRKTASQARSGKPCGGF